jgi:type IV secretory pathway VirD2 relaxase
MPSQAYSGPLFDLLSYARRGPGRRDHLSPGEIQQVARTVRRTPEVMVKVLPKSANTLGAVRKHLGYIGRRGELDLETDDGERLRGTRVGKDLVEDWDLDLDAYRRKSDLTATRGKEPARLVHKLIFSMPAGTPAGKVLAAVGNFCREEFALKHRYAMALHIDEPHPHVHVVIKALSEQGERLHIRKATLLGWRTEFARHLRALGVPANATQRYIRGETSPRKSDGIYRASLRAESTHLRERAEAVARELAKGELRVEPVKSRLIKTHSELRSAWLAVSDSLIRDGQTELSEQVRRFAAEMPLPLTEKEHISAKLLERTRGARARQLSASR